MQAQGQPNFAGIDFNQYNSWQRVTTPSGGVYYAVPGTSYVYDPFLSAARGQPVLWANPTQRDEEIQRQRDIQDQQVRQAERAGSPEGQLLPIAGTVGGTVGSAYLIRELTKDGKEDAVKEVIKQTTGNAATPGGSLTNPGTVTQPQTPTIIQTPATTGEAFTQGAMGGGVQPVGSGVLTDGTPGTLMSDGSVQAEILPSGTEVTQSGEIVSTETGQVVGRVAQGAFGAYQIYDGVNQFQQGDEIGGGLGIASGAANVGAALGSQTAGAFAAPLAIAQGGYQTFQGMQSGGEGMRAGLTSLGAGIGTLGLPGLGTALGAAAGNAIGYGLQGDGIKNDLVLGAVAPPLLVAKKLGLTDKLIRKTTRQYAQEKTKELEGVAPDDQQYQDYVAGMRAQYNQAPPDPSKPFAGKYGSWEEYKEAGLEAPDLTGVYGNIKTYGPDWAKLTQEQRIAITQANIDSGIYDSKKGDVIITNEDRARENFNNVLRGSAASGAEFGAPQVNNQAPPATVAEQPVLQSAAVNKPAYIANPPAELQRSQTLSPGINMQGNRIDYNSMGKELARRMNRRR